MAALSSSSSLCLSSNLKSSQRTAFLTKVIDWNSSGTTFLLEKPIVVVYTEREREREKSCDKKAPLICLFDDMMVTA